MEIERADLLSFYISADPSLKSKVKKSTSDWVVKFLYNQERMTMDEIVGAFSRFLETPTKLKSQISDAVDLLVGKGIVTPQDKEFKYGLTPKYRAIIAKRKENVNILHEYVYQTYFKNANLGKEIVLNWFRDVTIQIFRKYFFDLYVDKFHAENVHENYRPEIEKIIDESFAHISADSETLSFLKQQYLKFLKEDDNKSAQLFLHYGMANFSALLFTANNFVNRISLDIFENMTLLLDTNVLLVLRIEEGDLYKAFPLLESIFKQQNVKLEYLPQTACEYDRSIKHNHECMRAVVKSGAQRSILQPMQERNVFLRAIINRGYTSVEEVDKLFAEQKMPPTTFYNDVPIELSDRIASDDKNYQIETDKSTVALTAFQQKLGIPEKKGNRLAHDAALLAAVNIIRSRAEKFTILTSDYILQEYAKDDVKNNNIPVALSFSAVVTMLEYLQSDPTSHASNVAPLFKRMFAGDMLSLPEEISPSDISVVYAYDHNIKMLDDEAFRDVIHKVKEKQLNNDSDADIADMISTYIHGKLQGKNDEDYDNRQRIRELERTNAKHEEQEKSDSRLIVRLVRYQVKRDREYERVITWVKMVGIILLFVVGGFLLKVLPEEIGRVYGNIVGAIPSVLGVGFFLKFVDFKHLSSKWVNNKSEIEAEVDARVKEYTE